jgi:hypothetical protein
MGISMVIASSSKKGQKRSQNQTHGRDGGNENP